MRIIPKSIMIFFAALAMGVSYTSVKLWHWHRDRQVIIELCQETLFIHDNQTRETYKHDSKMLLRSPSSLRDTILRNDFIELNKVIRNIDLALDRHKLEIKNLGPSPKQSEIDSLEITFSTGIYESLVIQQQVLWQEITVLHNWRPGLTSKQVLDQCKRLDLEGLEIFTANTIKSLH